MRWNNKSTDNSDNKIVSVLVFKRFQPTFPLSTNDAGWRPALKLVFLDSPVNPKPVLIKKTHLCFVSSTLDWITSMYRSICAWTWPQTMRAEPLSRDQLSLNNITIEPSNESKTRWWLTFYSAINTDYNNPNNDENNSSNPNNSNNNISGGNITSVPSSSGRSVEWWRTWCQLNTNGPSLFNKISVSN